MENKIFTSSGIEFKAGEQGVFEAVFATMNVIDFDGDLTLPGAFGTQRTIVEAWNHATSQPPIGEGVVSERGNEAIITGRLFLDTAAGKEHYHVLRERGEAQEWSYSFRVLDSERGTYEGKSVNVLRRLEVWGVGPVTRAAGLGTRTTSVKSSEPAALGMAITEALAAHGDDWRANAPGLKYYDGVLRKLEAEELRERVRAHDERMAAQRAKDAAARKTTRADLMMQDFLRSHDDPDWARAMVDANLYGRAQNAYNAGRFASVDQAYAAYTRWARTPIR